MCLADSQILCHTTVIFPLLSFQFIHVLKRPCIRIRIGYANVKVNGQGFGLFRKWKGVRMFFNVNINP